MNVFFFCFLYLSYIDIIMYPSCTYYNIYQRNLRKPPKAPFAVKSLKYHFPQTEVGLFFTRLTLWWGVFSEQMGLFLLTFLRFYYKCFYYKCLFSFLRFYVFTFLSSLHPSLPKPPMRRRKPSNIKSTNTNPRSTKVQTYVLTFLRLYYKCFYYKCLFSFLRFYVFTL
jgi:hypothetical protein